MAAFKPQPVSDPLPQPGGQPVSFDAPIPGNGPPDGQPDDGSGGGKFKQFYSNNKWYVWATVLGIVIIGALAFFAFRNQTPERTQNADVTIDVTAPETVPSGGEVIYKVQITNHDPAELVDMDLELVYEDGISYVSSTPPADNLSGSRFPVPDLGSGENVVLMIKTTAQGNINEDKRVVARLHYKFSNFNSEFTEEASHSVRLVAADIILDITGPETANNIQTANYNVYYRNDSNKTISNARVQITYPDEFKFADSDPKPSLSQSIWNISNLEQNGTGKISFSGAFPNVRSGQSVQFKVEFLALDDSGSFFTQSSTTYMTTIVDQALAVEQKLANEAPGGVVSPGNSLQYEVKYQNNTAVVATGVNVVIELDSKAIDPATVRAESGFVEGNVLTWNAASVPQLERLNPQESGTVRFSVQIKNPAVKDGSKNVEVITKSKIKSNENPTFLTGNELKLKVSSPSNIERGLAHVSGPLPPKVGQTTTLQVAISLRNASNDYREGVLTGFVPLGVNFDQASVSGGESAAVKFDSATGKLTWTVGQLAAHSGSINPLRALKFNVTVTPNANQVNQPITLFKTISFAAKDSFTEQTISLQSQEVSTDNLPGEAQGRVQP